MLNKSSVISLILKCCAKTAKVITRDFAEIEKLQVSKKGVGDFVTHADIKAEKMLLQELKKARPQYSFLLEESGEIAAEEATKDDQDRYRWIVDPIDGTFNFMHGNPNFCISVGLERITANNEHEIVAGVICCPALREVYWAEKGKGAYLIDQDDHETRIRVANRLHIEETLCAANAALNLHSEKENALLKLLKAQNVKFRISGASALDMAYVASGRIDIFIHDNVKLWDIAAGIILVKEAGGTVTDLCGSNKIIHGTDGIVATNSTLYHKLMHKNKKTLLKL